MSLLIIPLRFILQQAWIVPQKYDVGFTAWLSFWYTQMCSLVWKCFLHLAAPWMFAHLHQWPARRPWGKNEVSSPGLFPIFKNFIIRVGFCWFIQKHKWIHYNIYKKLYHSKQKILARRKIKHMLIAMCWSNPSHFSEWSHSALQNNTGKTSLTEIGYELWFDNITASATYQNFWSLTQWV